MDYCMEWEIGWSGGVEAYILQLPMSPQTRSWLEDLKEYLRLLATPIIVYGVFLVMRRLHMREWFVDALENLDQVATVLISAAFLYVAVRRAFAQALIKSRAEK
jgi:hypothetical protein